MNHKLIKRLEKIIGKFSNETRIDGGIVEKKSNCCNALLNYAMGIKVLYCSKCGKIYEEPVVR